MADSLFDNRYRYDYIYPRGRSGETLRAVDTQAQDRPVVVKRPAPHDAPPIRSGQEVSILNERKALSRLAGHPALTELLGSGQFLVSGIVHQYIVVERAQGAVLADMVRELAARGERMPDLELLLIVDTLLDLLERAHAHDIVYNDVDAKHLFWDRDTYRLKVIDWGNAVFLEGDEVTPQGVSRQSDVYQVGELLYFVLTGGARMEVPRDAGEEFRLDFGEDGQRISPRLQTIVSRAAHPNARLRYRTIAELRQELQEFRAPLERERDIAVNRVLERLKSRRSKEELQALLQTLEPALLMDPGSPPARQAFAMIEDRLSDLEVAGDLDAARIYLDSANWARAAGLLDELRGRTRGETASLVKLLREWSRMLERARIEPPPLAVMDAIALAFDGDMAAAAHALLTQSGGDPSVRSLGLALAERIAAHHPEVIVLRPNLYRIEMALSELESEEQPVSEPRAMLAEITQALDTLAGIGIDKRKGGATASLTALRDGYRALVDRLAMLGTLIESALGHDMAALRRMPFDALERAAQATMALADNMHVIGKQAVASPRDARAALESSQTINPGAPTWEQLRKLLDNLYELLQSYQTYVPAADGSDLGGWLTASARDLQPFTERLFDEMLVGMIAGLGRAAVEWTIYADAAVRGSRMQAVTALVTAAEAVGTVSPTLAGWFNHLRTNVANGPYVERYALHGALGRALADGWDHFDHGRFAEAERLGAQAFSAARSDNEQEAARRLRELSELARMWMERGGLGDANRTKTALQAVENLFTSEERATRLQFTRQMPSQETYLRAMPKALVETFARTSTASVRILFLSYIMQGALDAAEDRLDEADFWREAALRTLPDAARHPSIAALADLIQRRIDLLQAAALLNEVDGPYQLSSLDRVRHGLENNVHAKLLGSALHSLRELEAGARDWADGEFRAAGIKIENAIKAIDDLESQAQITVTHYRAWLLELLNHAAELHQQMRRMQTTIEQRPETPDPSVRAAHRMLVETTESALGPSYAATLRQWRDTYEQFLGVYTDKSLRRSARLSRFNDLLRAMFIDRHPAYPLYRHWYNLTDAAPEFPAPPTDEPTPRIDEGEPGLEPPPFQRIEMQDAELAEETPARRRGIPRPLLIGLPLLLLIGAAVIALNSGGADGDPTAPPTTDPGAVIAEESSSPLVGMAQASDTPRPPTETPLPPPVLATIPPRPTETLGPSETPTPITPTMTGTPTLTRTPSITPTATATSTPSATPLPAEGVRGVQSLLQLAGMLAAPGWTVEQFAPIREGAFWRLGTGGVTGGETLVVTIPPELLDAQFGNRAASRIISMEADVRLETYNPALLIDDQVYFGIMLQNAGNPVESAGVQINLVQQGVVNIGQRVGDVNAVISQRSLGDIRVRLRLDRNPDTGAITTFVNGEPVGLPLTLPAPLGVIPALLVKDGGVIVYVSSWTIALR